MSSTGFVPVSVGPLVLLPFAERTPAADVPNQPATAAIPVFHQVANSIATQRGAKTPRTFSAIHATEAMNIGRRAAIPTHEPHRDSPLP